MFTTNSFPMLLQPVVPRIKNCRIVLIHHQCTSEGQPHCRKPTCTEYVHSRKCDMRFTYTHLDKQFLLNLCGHCHGFLCYPPYWSDYVTILELQTKERKEAHGTQTTKGGRTTKGAQTEQKNRNPLTDYANRDQEAKKKLTRFSLTAAAMRFFVSAYWEENKEPQNSAQ